jgi:hypothetical protein
MTIETICNRGHLERVGPRQKDYCGAKWVTAQREAAQQQQDESIVFFWRQAVRRAAEQEARVRGARCVERP